MANKSVAYRELNSALTDLDRVMNHLAHVYALCDPVIHEKERKMVEEYAAAVGALIEGFKKLQSIF